MTMLRADHELELRSYFGEWATGDCGLRSGLGEQLARARDGLGWSGQVASEFMPPPGAGFALTRHARVRGALGRLSREDVTTLAMQYGPATRFAADGLWVLEPTALVALLTERARSLCTPAERKEGVPGARAALQRLCRLSTARRIGARKVPKDVSQHAAAEVLLVRTQAAALLARAERAYVDARRGRARDEMQAFVRGLEA